MIDLALIDLTPISTSVIRLAHAWGKAAGVQVHLLHDLRPRLPALASSSSREAWYQTGEASARETTAVLVRQALGEGHFPPVHITRNEMLSAIGRLHEHHHVRTLFTGAKGTGTLQRLLRGSHILPLVEQLNIPVVAVPLEYRHTGPVDLHVAVGQEHLFDPKCLSSFVGEHPAMVRSVEFFSVDQPDARENSEARLQDLARRADLPVPVTIASFRSEDPPEIFKEKLANQPSGMLVLKRGSRSLMDHVGRRFMVNDMVHEGSLPLIILS
jgi:nucleotide-binding universal stress UspA family protein